MTITQRFWNHLVDQGIVTTGRVLHDLGLAPLPTDPAAHQVGARCVDAVGQAR